MTERGNNMDYQGIVKENVLALQAQRKAEAERDEARAEAARYRAERDELAEIVKFYRRTYTDHYRRYISSNKARKRRMREFFAELGLAGLVTLGLVGLCVLAWNVTMAYWM